MKGKIIYPNDVVFELLNEAECNRVRDAIVAGYNSLTIQRTNEKNEVEQHEINLANRVNFITTREKNKEELKEEELGKAKE